MLALKQISFGLLIILIYTLGIWALKENFYIGWTWKGFVSDYKSILTFAAFLAPPVFLVWAIYKNHTPNESVISSARKIISGPFLSTALVVEFLIVFLLSYFVIQHPESISEDLEFHVSQQNWKYAEDELNRLQKLPIRKGILFAFEHYIDSHKRSNGNQFKEGQFHRAQRIAVKRKIEVQSELDYLNILSFSELSKIIYFVEDRNEDELGEAIALLQLSASKTNDSKKKGQFYLKAGDLLLASKNYKGAMAIYGIAQPYIKDKTMLSILRANLGNISASTGNYQKAAQLYRDAETFYPEGRRDVFYSNFGYLLMLGGKYPEAEEAVKNALAINSEDWYSYLNLALIYDAQGQYEDAIKSYDEVILRTKKGDHFREAKILKAYSLISGMGKEKEGLLLILEAVGRSTETIEKIMVDSAKKKDVYRRASKALRDTNTHGIEKYVKFFEDKQII